jgi:hypothetical protein
VDQQYHIELIPIMAAIIHATERVKEVKIEGLVRHSLLIILGHRAGGYNLSKTNNPNLTLNNDNNDRPCSKSSSTVMIPSHTW